MKKLYSNIGKKLRGLAMVCGGIGIFCIAVGVIVELLDMGVITQEEFDAKKKQLLGL